MSYKDYLNSNWWNYKKENSKKARGFRFGCIVCGNKDYDIHHLTYDVLGHENISKHLIPLCRKHHEEFHIWQKENNKLVGDIPQWMRLFYKDKWKKLNKQIKGKIKQFTSDRIGPKSKKPKINKIDNLDPNNPF